MSSHASSAPPHLPPQPTEVESSSQPTSNYKAAPDAQDHKSLPTLPTSETTQLCSAFLVRLMSSENQNVPFLEPLSSSDASQIASASQMQMFKNSEANQDRQYLTSLPPELLIKALSEVPPSSFLALTQTSKALHVFIKTNAARICNMAIRSRFPYEAKLLEVTTEARDKDIGNNERWLLPANGKLEEQEKTYFDWVYDNGLWWQRCQGKTCNNYGLSALRTSNWGCGKFSHERRNRLRCSHYSLLGTNWTDESELNNNFIHFGVPGPHFLHLLESVPLEVSNQRFKYHNASTDIAGKRSYFRFAEHEFENFMGTFNFRLVSAKHRKVRREDEGFPKELIWYFGVDKLVFEERGRGKTKL